MPYKDPEKQKAAKRRHYERNSQSQIDRVTRRRHENREWLTELKSTLVCSRCGEDHPATIHFHHTNPEEKEMNISAAVHFGWSRKRIEEEIAKCVVLCANCHAKEHASMM